MLSKVARLLTLSLDELMGQPAPSAALAAAGKAGRGKRGLASRLARQFQAAAHLPKTKQQFVSRIPDTALAQVSG